MIDELAVQRQDYVQVAEKAQRLVGTGILTKRMNYHIGCPSSAAFISFSNKIGDRRLLAKISYNADRQAEGAFELIVTEEDTGRKTELISVSRHADLERQIKVGKGFLCYNHQARCPIAQKGEKQLGKKGEKKPTISLRVDVELRRAFEEAAEATGESHAVVLRQLMRYFIGKGPDPSIRYSRL